MQHWRIGSSYSASRTELVLGDSDGLAGGGPLTPRLDRHAVSASLEYRLDDTWTLGGALGASITGTLDLGSERHTLDPGFIAVVSASRRLADMDPYFAVMGLSLGVSSVGTRSSPNAADGQLTSGDIRLNITAGRLFADVIAPYLALRAFGGPVFWQRDGRSLAGGTDRYHVQAGLGLLLTSRAGIDGFVEISPVGERAVTSGLGVSF